MQPPNSGCRRCNGEVTINESTHTVAFSLSYYQLGQVSEFVQPGAIRRRLEQLRELFPDQPQPVGNLPRA